MTEVKFHFSNTTLSRVFTVQSYFNYYARELKENTSIKLHYFLCKCIQIHPTLINTPIYLLSPRLSLPVNIPLGLPKLHLTRDILPITSDNSAREVPEVGLRVTDPLHSSSLKFRLCQGFYSTHLLPHLSQPNPHFSSPRSGAADWGLDQCSVKGFRKFPWPLVAATIGRSEKENQS